MLVTTNLGIADSFKRRRCGDKDNRTRGQAGPDNGHIPTVIDHAFLLLVGRFMLFIDHDQAKIGKRQKESRPGPDQHADPAF